MSRDLDLNQTVIEGREQLLEYFRSGFKPASERGVGTEHEKFLFHRDDGRVITFDEEGGIEDLFEALVDRFGWEPARDRGRIVALMRGEEAITLEPGGQVELSGAVTSDIFETRDEFDAHIAEVSSVAGDAYHAVSWGMNPFDDLEDVSWVPKARYGIMRDYLPTRGDLAHWMMKTTCTIQANVDYVSEEDAVDIIRVGLHASPIVTSLFANSPLRRRRETGFQSFRAHVWTRTDPDRTGVPSFMFRDDWGFDDYLEYALDVPMFFIRRDVGYVDMSGRSFREFMVSGHEGWEANMGDFELHLSTIFPEVRLKTFIEFRSADGGSRSHILALPALWKGLIYDDDARRETRELFADIDEAAHGELMRVTARDGIHGSFRGRPIRDIAGDLIEIAGRGLDALADAADHASERPFLAPLVDVVESESSPSDRLMEAYDELGGDRLEIIRRYDILSPPESVHTATA